MKPIITTILAVILAAILVAGAQTNDEAKRMFKVAQNAEVVDGDLPAAIEAYKQVIEKADKDRPLAAKALMQIGLCHEKLGNSEARRAYEQIISSYSDQRELAAKAQTRLAGLNGPSSPESTFTLKRLEFPQEAKDMSVSPWNVSADGRYFAATEYETGNAAIVDAKSGTYKAVTKYGNWDQKNGFVDGGAISRDGKQIAFWHYKYSATEGNLRVVGRDGKGERTLYRAKVLEHGIEWGIPMDWSPDGKHIVVQLERGKPGVSGGITDFVLVSSVDGSVRVMKTYQTKRRYRPKIMFSPDGRFLAYDFPPRKEVVHGDIFVLPLNGGPEVTVAAHPAQDTFLGWAPDGSILFTSDRTGSIGLHRVKITKGSQAGEPELLRPNIGTVHPLGITRSGAFYYSERTSSQNAFIASLDFETGKITVPPRLLTERFTNSSSTPAWSADGRQLVYTHHRGDGTPDTLIIRADSGGNERQVLPAVRLRRGSRIRWHANGESLLALGASETESGLYRIDAKTGEVALLLDRSNIASWAAVDWTPDGKWVFVAGGESRRAIIRRDAVSGEEKILYRGKSSARSFRISPDGRQLVFVARAAQPGEKNVLRLLSIEEGEVRDLFSPSKTDGGFAWAGLVTAWTPDGRHILFVTQKNGTNPPGFQLWTVPVDGGKASKAELTIRGGPLELNIHPDGKRIVFSTLVSKTDYWVMENFLPTVSASK